MKRPLVVKLGSSLVVDDGGRPRRALLRARAAEIAEIVERGTPVCVVSSGAIALGLRRLGLAKRPSSLPRLQAASALGQAALQRAWQDALEPHGLEAAQILLTSAEIGERRAYVNVRSALAALFALGAVPVVNENDATATDEISFGDICKARVRRRLDEMGIKDQEAETMTGVFVPAGTPGAVLLDGFGEET